MTESSPETPPRQSVPGTAVPVVPPDVDTPEIIPGVRQDIRYLGAILGDIIREQEGQEVFDLVESARRAAFGIRQGDGTVEDVDGEFEVYPPEGLTAMEVWGPGGRTLVEVGAYEDLAVLRR
ncbi:hypothetical protein, partial [Corynebacterium variabile]|uniref:hypothetical protein n=1 Tax=Corynebacterium variabile TaxID=1727 RepID=UPI0028A9AAFF